MLHYNNLKEIISKLNQDAILIEDKFQNACRDFNTWYANLEQEFQKTIENKKDNNINVLLANNNSTENISIDISNFEICEGNDNKKTLLTPKYEKYETAKKPQRNASKLASLKINQQSQVKLNTKLRRPEDGSCNSIYIDVERLSNIKTSKNKSTVSVKPFAELTNIKIDPPRHTISKIVQRNELITVKNTGDKKILNCTSESANNKTKENITAEVESVKNFENNKNINSDDVATEDTRTKTDSILEGASKYVNTSTKKTISFKFKNYVSPLKILQNRIKTKQNITPLKLLKRSDLSVKKQLNLIASPQDTNVKVIKVKEAEKNITKQTTESKNNVMKHNTETKLCRKLEEQKRIREEKQIKVQKTRQHQERMKEEKLKLKILEKEEKQMKSQQGKINNKSKLNESQGKHIFGGNKANFVPKNAENIKIYLKKTTVPLVYRDIVVQSNLDVFSGKKHPWGEKAILDPQLLAQRYIPENFIETLFNMKATTPDLRKIFKKIPDYKLVRRSSATWS